MASVDTRTEEQILTRLRDIMAERTTILIAHRISTVMAADHIIVLDEGRIVEEGTHERIARTRRPVRRHVPPPAPHRRIERPLMPPTIRDEQEIDKKSIGPPHAG